MKSLEENIKNIVNSCGVELYDIKKRKENKNTYYTIYITSKNGITLDMCAKISRLISPILDVYSPFVERYFLEVSSPGIERKLKTKNHFLLSIGEFVQIDTNSNETIKGKLISADNNKIVIGDNHIKYNDIKTAKTYIS